MRFPAEFHTITKVLALVLALGAQGTATAQVCESTGFELQEASCGWEPGFICGSGFDGLCVAPAEGVCTGDNATDQNCCADNPNPLNGWYISSFSHHCKEPHIETANPASGSHHLRFQRDALGGFGACNIAHTSGCISAYTPTVGPQPISRTVIDFEIAMGDPSPGTPPFGSSGQYFTVADDETSGTGVRVNFDLQGVVFVYDISLGSYQGVGFLTGNGAYDHFQIDMAPCNNLVTYTLSNASGAVTGMYAHDFTGLNTTVQRAVMTNDNAGFFWDFDNYSVVRSGPCDVGVCCDRTPGGGEVCEEFVIPEDCSGEFQEWTLGTSCDGIVCQEATGACCDTSPGGGGTCTDDVLIGDCSGDLQQWTVSTLCSDIVCQEVSSGACCDRTPGQGSCLDATIISECTGPNEVWSVGTNCNQVACDEIEGACCDNFSGNCFVSTIDNCTGSDATWTEGVTCAETVCTAATGACCDTGSNDPTVATCTTTTLAVCDCTKCTWTRSASCIDILCDANFQVIPTASEWGILVLALALLVAAKVHSRVAQAERANPSIRPKNG